MTATCLDIQPAQIVRGPLEVPGDKSISHRYALLGAIARGTTALTHVAPGADVAHTLGVAAALGAGVRRTGPTAWGIEGRGPAGLAAPPHDLDCGNSGTTMRLVAGLVAGQPFHSRLDGDESLRRRPMARVIDPLTAMGARIASAHGRAPLSIDGGGLRGLTWTPPVASAQVKSAILLAGLYASGPTTVREAAPTRDHTERAFDLFAVAHERGADWCRVPGGRPDAVAPGASLRVPGDPSSAAVWAALAAVLPGSHVELTGLCLNPHRLGFVRVLERMGADLRLHQEADAGGEPVGVIEVTPGAARWVTVLPSEVPAVIDELPVLAAAGALGGGLEVAGAEELRVKESDRISALVAGLRALGVDADERPDGFAVPGGQRPRGGQVDACGDHRLVMAFSVIAAGASGPTRITGADSVAVSYPEFERDWAAVVKS